MTDEKIRVVCDACGAKYSVPASSAGRSFKCKQCDGRLSVRAPSALGVRRSELPQADPPAAEPRRRTSVPGRMQDLIAEALNGGKHKIDEVYQQGDGALKQKLARAAEAGKEALTGKKGYKLGAGTLMVMKDALLHGNEGVDALRVALEAERRIRGEVNPVKEALVIGYVVDDYHVDFAGEHVAALKNKPRASEEGIIQLVTDDMIPTMLMLQQRFRGLEPQDSHIAEALATLEFREGRRVRVVFRCQALQRDSATYEVAKAGKERTTGAYVYRLAPLVDHVEGTDARIKRRTGR